MLLLPSHVHTAHRVGLPPKCAEHTALRKKHMEKLPLLEAGTSHSLSWHAQVHKGKVMSQGLSGAGIEHRGVVAAVRGCYNHNELQPNTVNAFNTPTYLEIAEVSLSVIASLLATISCVCIDTAPGDVLKSHFPHLRTLNI